jgi:hypothetical protein
MNHACRVRLGQVFRDAKPPQRVWRVTERRDEHCRLERIDKPNIVRYPSLTALLDTNRYIPGD